MAPAPINHVRQDALDDLNTLLRGRDGGSSGDGNKRGNGANGDDNGGNGGNNKGDDGGRGGDGQANEHDSPPASLTLPPSPAVISSSVAQTTSTAVTTIPKTVVVTSTAAPTSTSSPSTSISTSTTTPTFISSPFPMTTTTTSSLSSITPFAPDTSSQPRKGLSDDPHSGTKTKTHNATATVLSDMAASSTSSSSLELPALPNGHHGGDGLSPTSDHVLVAFGTIGAFIIFLAVIYLIGRMKKIDLLSKARGREFSRGGSRGWYSWREREMDYTTDGPPPRYPGHDEAFEYPSEQKSVPSQRHLDAFYSPTTIPTLATPESAAAMSRGADTQRQEIVREALLDNPAPFGVSPPQPTEQSAIQSFDTQPSYDPSSTYNPDATYNSNAATAALSRQNSDAYDPALRELNHMSYLSSLSSGFGDQIIIPEPAPTKPNHVQASRQSYRQSRKLSWAASVRGPQGDRDTIYTTTSEDSTPPRFRTINSWVAQQYGRVQKQQQREDEIPAMPEIPKPLQARVGVDHQRKPSEDPAFRYHPGDEIEISRGSRIPSTILDKKFGIN